MHEPAFWHRPSSFTARLLSPVAAAYGAIASQRMARPGVDVGIPVICIGNYHMGGAGKTQVVLALADLLRDMGEAPFVVSRGYGGNLQGPVQVGPTHRFWEVGDEPLMMAARVPVVIARDRAAGARVAKAGGANVILLDDGFQNPALRKDVSLIVVDGKRGLGNGRVFPAGPLRAPLAPQLARTDGLIVIGGGGAADPLAAAIEARGGVILRATIVPDPDVVAALRGRPVLAFAGIGDPARFFRTLRTSGVDVVATKTFADHHPFSADEIAALAAEAARDGLMLLTTQKDAVRLRGGALGRSAQAVMTFPVSLRIADEPRLRCFVAERLRRTRENLR
jgi:tetraacyldisaccharide 4'-kinase